MIQNDEYDPADAVRKRVVNSLTPDEPYAPPDAPPVLPVPAPAPVAPRISTEPVPGRVAATTPTAPTAPAPPQAGHFANTQQGFLDWATQKYGADPTRGGGFVNAQAGGGLQKMAADYAAATGNTANFLGGPSGDQVDFGQGVSDALTSGGQIWNPAGGGGAAGAPGGGGAAGGLGGVGGGTGASGNAYTDQVRAMLMTRIKNNMAPVNEQDSGIKDAMDAARLEAGRASDQERRDLAERAYASGDLGGDTIRQGIMQSAEKNAVGLGGMRAKLIAQEYQARRSDLNDAMQQALASGDAQMAREVQQALAQLDATVRREGLGVQMAQFAQGQNVNTVTKAADK
jgi:hypothetical protein